MLVDGGDVLVAFHGGEVPHQVGEQGGEGHQLLLVVDLGRQVHGFAEKWQRISQKMPEMLVFHYILTLWLESGWWWPGLWMLAGRLPPK